MLNFQDSVHTHTTNPFCEGFIKLGIADHFRKTLGPDHVIEVWKTAALDIVKRFAHSHKGLGVITCFIEVP